MKLFEFTHEPPTKCGGCLYKTSRSYWMAESREIAERGMEQETDEGEPSGLCSDCMAELLAENGHEIARPE